jgi:protein-S-isoprenylcysteine O-methyltransferase Ste14
MTSRHRLIAILFIWGAAALSLMTLYGTAFLNFTPSSTLITITVVILLAAIGATFVVTRTTPRAIAGDSFSQPRD